MQVKTKIIRGRGWCLPFCVLVVLSGATHAFLRPAPSSSAPSTDGGATQPVTPQPTPDGRAQTSDNVFYDQTNPDFQHLQQPHEALRGLPRDREGKVDWMGALRNRAIVPRATVEGFAPDQVIDLDIVMKNTRAMPYVLFPHRAHTEWLACKNCHPIPFEEKAGSTMIKMEDIFRGQFCGVCHDRVAFVTHRNCARCHSIPQPPLPIGP